MNAFTKPTAPGPVTRPGPGRRSSAGRSPRGAERRPLTFSARPVEIAHSIRLRPSSGRILAIDCATPVAARSRVDAPMLAISRPAPVVPPGGFERV